MAKIFNYYIVKPDQDYEVFRVVACADDIENAVRMWQRNGGGNGEATILCPVTWHTAIRDVTNTDEAIQFINGALMTQEDKK